jgi:hypothetical protein
VLAAPVYPVTPPTPSDVYFIVTSSDETVPVTLEMSRYTQFPADIDALLNPVVLAASKSAVNSALRMSVPAESTEVCSSMLN